MTCQRVARWPYLILIAALLIPGTGLAQEGAMETDEETLYFLGVAIGRNLSAFDLDDEEVEIVVKGVRDVTLGNAKDLDTQVYGPKVQALQQERATRAAAKEAEKAKEFVANAAKTEGAKTTESGLVYITTQEGGGAAPSASDRVKVHYHGTLRDGTVFDSSVQRGVPAEFPLNRVVPCWTEGLQLMKVGGKATLVCPPDLAYGDRGAPPSIPGGAALNFDVELIEIVE